MEKCKKCGNEFVDMRALKIHYTTAHGKPPGRPSLRDDKSQWADTLRKIEDAAALGCSLSEIALYAGVHRETLRVWCNEDEALGYRIEELRERPILKARQTVVAALNDPEHAKWYLERKARNEFASRKEISGSDGAPLQASVIMYPIAKELPKE